MKSLLKYVFLTAVAALMLPVASCSGTGDVERPYDSSLCENLAILIERHDSISQEQYREMIGQNAAILHYIIDRTREISEEPGDEQNGSWRQLLADPDYLERFGYMFTLGSALYQADADGLLDKDNQHLYKALDEYNRQLAEYSDRN